MRKELAKTYDPASFEDRLYHEWEEKGYFRAERDPAKKPYTIVIPPPNITGQLHMGHALDETLQDILIRYKRMQGYAALWVPGTDHASIATEAKIVEKMRTEGVTKDDLGREGFLERAWEWKRQYGGRILEQLKKLGSSCDWSRERFTLDEGCSEAVREVFVRLYEKGLIYRGERIVNWCPKCRTTISDAEVEYEEQQGHFWHLRYPFTDGSGEIQLATTRPETLLGDTAVAVNPNDARYRELVGKTLTLPLVGREIPVVADDYVDMEFGTGVVKITPAHDPNDFEVGLRHHLPLVNVLTEDARINENGGEYAGMDRYEARRAIAADLEAGGFLVKTEPHAHNVGTCYRCHTTVEPRVSKQWFVKMEPLAKPAIEAVRTGETKFVPERFEKIYFNWLENIRDWCISRQLWWGHRIPAWYCADCGETTVSRAAPQACSHCGSQALRQDPDTLDTWFSSALWPFSTLGWPQKTEDFDYFYPTDTLVTGYDIIPFWVMRMMFSGLEHTGRPPFHHVFIHGLMRDAQGRKMSKSLGNGVDPLELIAEYGADALRLALVTGNSPGNDMRFSDDKIKAARNFANKLWNASRFILMNLSDEIEAPGLPETLTIEDKWALSQYNRLVREVTENLDKYELGVAEQKIYDFLWDVFCDWYIELTKTRLQTRDEAALGAQRVLVTIMTGTLKLLHPFMPFITEEIWRSFPNDCESILLAPWPEYRPELDFSAEEREFERIMEAVRAIRNLRTERGVPPSRKAAVYLVTEHTATFEAAKPFFVRLASASEVFVSREGEIGGALQAATRSARIFLPLSEVLDVEQERARLTKEKEACEKELARLSGKLANESFTAKAPPAVVQNERDKLQKARELQERLEATLANLG